MSAIMPNKECTVDGTAYELVRQTDTSTACGGCVACHSEDNIDTPSKKVFCSLLDDCFVDGKLYHVWTLKEIK